MARGRHPEASCAADTSEPAGRDWVQRVRRALLNWYRRCGRDLPWRQSRDPYSVWVSEVMLQQTQVKTMIPYFERWMQRFPNVRALAAASEHDVVLAWEGLGYYSRARALRQAARRLAREHPAELPRDVAELQRLPGIGAYTAGAIASIAHGRPVPAVDGNVSRVLCRLQAWTDDPTRAPTKGQVWKLAGRLVGRGRAAEINQSLMDLGAIVCTPRGPSCSSCPVRRDCRAAGLGVVGDIPRPATRPAYARRHEVAGLVRRRGRWLVVQRPLDEQRWAGLWVFPHAEVRAHEGTGAALRRALGAAGLTGRLGPELMRLGYQVTRFRTTLEVHVCTGCSGRATPVKATAVAWKRSEELEQLAMPAAHRRIASRLPGLDASPGETAGRTGCTKSLGKACCAARG